MPLHRFRYKNYVRSMIPVTLNEGARETMLGLADERNTRLRESMNRKYRFIIGMKKLENPSYFIESKREHYSDIGLTN